MIVPLVLVILVLLLIARERRAYRSHAAARSRFHADVDELLDVTPAEIFPFPPSAPAASLPLASGRTPARTARAPVAGADTSRSGVQERLAASDLGYLGPHRKVSRWVEPPLKDKRAPESWHSDRGRAPTPAKEFDDGQDIGRSTGPAT